MIAVVDKASKTANRPWYESPGLWWTVATGGGGTGIVRVFSVAMRSSRRRNFAQELQSGTEHLTNVTIDLEETEIAAKILPTGSIHAAELERRFADFMSTCRESFDSQAELDAAGMNYCFSGRGVDAAKNFKTDARKLDLTDDAIIAAAALCARSASWEEAWRAQTKPLADDRAQISTLIDDVGPELQGCAAAVASYRESTTQSLESIGTQLKAERIDVDAAVDQLSKLRHGLTECLDDFGKAHIEAYAQNEE